MNWEEKAGGVSGRCGIEDDLTPELDLALREFRLSVHAWSEAVMSRPRQALAGAPRRPVWRFAAGWALSGVLIAGGLSAGVYGHHQQQMRIAHERIFEQQRQFAEQQAQQARLTDEDLLAKVDSDVSQAVPSAMEPLAQLMAGDESQ
jgi:uncharacterized protein HemX